MLINTISFAVEDCRYHIPKLVFPVFNNPFYNRFYVRKKGRRVRNNMYGI